MILVTNKDHLLKNSCRNTEFNHILIYKLIIEKNKKIYGKIKLNQLKRLFIGIIKKINSLQIKMILFNGGV